MWRWIASAWLLGIVTLSALASGWPGLLNQWTRGVPGRDKTGHFVLMGGLAAFAVLAFAGERIAGRRISGWTVLAIVSLFVIVEEVTQRWMIYRAFSFVDLAYSLAGVALVGGAALWWRSRPSAPSEGAQR